MRKETRNLLLVFVLNGVLLWGLFHLLSALL
jgi:hypothetical protein